MAGRKKYRPEVGFYKTPTKFYKPAYGSKSSGSHVGDAKEERPSLGLEGFVKTGLPEVIIRKVRKSGLKPKGRKPR